MKNLLKILCAAFAMTASAVEFGDIAADYPLYLANDPFAIGLARTNAAVKVNISDGASTNQTLMTATVPTFLSFTTNTVGALSAGQISWDSDWRTFKLGLGNGVENQVGQESQKLAKNVWTNTIPNGWAVMRSGAVGNSGKFEIVPAIATVGMSQGRVVGVATEDIAVGALGLVTIRGNVNQIGSNGSLYGSSGWLDMADLYLSHVHQGYLMTNPPPAPYTVVFMGSVINAANNGAIDVSVHCGTSMQDLNDVDGTPLTQSGQFPVWDNVRQVFDFTGNTNQFLTEETDTLATVASRGGFAGTEEIGPLRVVASRYGANAGFEASGSSWGAYGENAGSGASGSAWSAYGFDAGGNSHGDYWCASGVGSGVNSVGNYWGAYGYSVGLGSVHTNSHMFGKHAARNARGNNRLYIDVYDENPDYAADGATNDMVFGDNGYLYLGRGGGAPGGEQGGTLRGPWLYNGAPMVEASTVTNIVSAKLTGYVPTSQLSLTNGTVIYDGLYNGTNSVFFRTAAGTNYVLRLF